MDAIDTHSFTEHPTGMADGVAVLHFEGGRSTFLVRRTNRGVASVFVVVGEAEGTWNAVAAPEATAMLIRRFLVVLNCRAALESCLKLYHRDHRSLSGYERMRSWCVSHSYAHWGLHLVQTWPPRKSGTDTVRQSDQRVAESTTPVWGGRCGHISHGRCCNCRSPALMVRCDCCVGRCTRIAAHQQARACVRLAASGQQTGLQPPHTARTQVRRSAPQGICLQVCCLQLAPTYH